MNKEKEEAGYDQLSYYAELISGATKMKGVQVSVNRNAKEFLQPQRYEVGFRRGSHYDYRSLTYEEAFLALERIEFLLRMMGM